MTPAIEARDVAKVFGKGELAVHALRGVTMRVGRGEIVMLAGPSGSGKTTLLSIVGCVLQPTRGTVHLFGELTAPRPERQLPALRLAYIGFVFQGNNLIAALSSRDNVMLPLLLRGADFRTAAREADRLLDAVGLSEKRDRKPEELSGGQRQRVSIARALAGNAPLLLADEPTSNLDAHTGTVLMQLLRQLAKGENHTVVAVTHDPRIFPLADRVLHIEDGLLLEGEPPGGTL